MIKKHILLLAISAFCSVFIDLYAQVPYFIPKNGLLAWWPFNGNTNDESGNGHDLSAGTAKLAKDRFEKDASAMDLSGDFFRFPKRRNGLALWRLHICALVQCC